MVPTEIKIKMLAKRVIYGTLGSQELRVSYFKSQAFNV